MKPPKRIVVLDSAEHRLMLCGLLHFRNKLIQQHRYPDAIDELLIKVQGGKEVLAWMITQQLKAYIETHPFDPGTNECRSILEQLYQAYAELHESDPPEISEGFKELEVFLEALPLDDNNAVFNLRCRLCIAYECKAFLDGLQYGAHLINEHFKEDKQ